MKLGSDKQACLVGNSCGSFYAQMISPIHQFDCCNIYNKERVWGIFGEEDTLAHFEPLFLEHYTHSFHFPGGHTPTAEQFKTWYCPLIEKLLLEYP